jgi:hypothetical protein
LIHWIDHLSQSGIKAKKISRSKSDQYSINEIFQNFVLLKLGGEEEKITLQCGGAGSFCAGST